MLPDWVDVDAVKAIAAGAVFACAAGAVVALARLRNSTAKVVVVLALVAAGAGVFYYRSTLDECAKTCSCKLINDRLPSRGCAVVPESDEDGG